MLALHFEHILQRKFTSSELSLFHELEKRSFLIAVDQIRVSTLLEGLKSLRGNNEVVEHGGQMVIKWEKTMAKLVASISEEIAEAVEKNIPTLEEDIRRFKYAIKMEEIKQGGSSESDEISFFLPRKYRECRKEISRLLREIALCERDILAVWEIIDKHRKELEYINIWRKIHNSVLYTRNHIDFANLEDRIPFDRL